MEEHLQVTVDANTNSTVAWKTPISEQKQDKVTMEPNRPSVTVMTETHINFECNILALREQPKH